MHVDLILLIIYSVVSESEKLGKVEELQVLLLLYSSYKQLKKSQERRPRQKLSISLSPHLKNKIDVKICFAIYFSTSQKKSTFSIFLDDLF